MFPECGAEGARLKEGTTDKTSKAYMRRIIKADENRNERYAKTCKVNWNRDHTTNVLKYLTKPITIQS